MSKSILWLPPDPPSSAQRAALLAMYEEDVEILHLAGPLTIETVADAIGSHDASVGPLGDYRYWGEVCAEATRRGTFESLLYADRLV